MTEHSLVTTTLTVDWLVLLRLLVLYSVTLVIGEADVPVVVTSEPEFTLVQLMTHVWTLGVGPDRSLGRPTEKQNGFEMWRLLYKEYKLDIATRKASWFAGESDGLPTYSWSELRRLVPRVVGSCRRV